ncbi:MAG TPA: hypothetical protein VMA09_20025 [Candidatus Binataceae bacterium]|nr:hypothetical protein [Candidatus Binataceae bacterium]
MPSNPLLTIPREIAFPDALKQREIEIWRKGQCRRPFDRSEPTVGIGLSGGGIRSATFCLGVFQAFSRRQGLLGRLDYISSVSGGGFFAAFYGRLFTRKEIKNLIDVEKVLSPDQARQLDFPPYYDDQTRTWTRDWRSGVFKWLRENGRYLAPNGDGDLLTGITVFLRNWATVQLLISAAFLALFLFAEALTVYLPSPPLQKQSALWWSPYFYVAVFLALFLVVPLGWAYWTFTGAGPGMEGGGKPRLLARFAFSFGGFGTLASLAIFLLFVGTIVNHYSSDGSGLGPDQLWMNGIRIVGIAFIAWQAALLKAAWPPRQPVPIVQKSRNKVLEFLAATLRPIAAILRPNVVLRLFVILGTVVALAYSLNKDIITVSDWIYLLIELIGLFAFVAILELISPQVEPYVLINESESARGYLTMWLRAAFILTITLAAFSVLDTVGETLYALQFSHSFHLWRWIAVPAGAIVSLVPYAQSIATYLLPKKNKRLSLPLSVIALAGALIIVLPYLTSLDLFAHAIAYDFGIPRDAPQNLTHSQSCKGCAQHAFRHDCSVGNQKCARLSAKLLHLRQTVSELIKSAPAVSATTTSGEAEAPPPARLTCRRVTPLAFFLVLTLLFTLLTGSYFSGGVAWVFVNRTALHALYAARLIRAYLGASNKARFQPVNAGTSNPNQAGSQTQSNKSGNVQTPPGVTRPVDGDDIPQEEYFYVPAKEPTASAPDDFWIKAPPLHLVNVTINETIEGRSQTEERDRKGLGLAVGPAGFSAGVQHHAIFKADTRIDSKGVFSPIEVKPPPGTGYRVFDNDEEDHGRFQGQRLSLGNWTAISGAAVSTGLGNLTSLGTSMLTAFFNVRLGYWWDSGTPSKAPRGLSGLLGKLFAGLLPVQASLLDEFMGRFRGTIRRYWYLSDGGHFENMGGYELIRRRLPLIILIDAGADPDYEFQDLSNLIRKARLDFNAEIIFLDPNAGLWPVREMAAKYFAPLSNFLTGFGTLEELRRGTPAAGSLTFEDNPELSLKHGAIARIKYLDEPEENEHYLILIKPTLIGEEPEDLLNYHTAHPSFPQETTAEQFFDEAQWESYRRLGQHIADRLFQL